MDAVNRMFISSVHCWPFCSEALKVVQVVGVAEVVQYPAIIEVGFPAIITEDALVVWQNPHLVQRSLVWHGN